MIVPGRGTGLHRVGDPADAGSGDPAYRIVQAACPQAARFMTLFKYEILYPRT